MAEYFMLIYKPRDWEETLYGPVPEIGAIFRSHSSHPITEGGEISVTRIDKQIPGQPEVYVPIPLKCLRDIDEEKLDLLEAISKPSDRYKVFIDDDWTEEGRQLSAGNTVMTFAKRYHPKHAVGKVMYKGPIQGLQGTYFGIQLLGKFRGTGSSDGEFRKRRYFKTEKDCAIFVSLDRVRAMDNAKIMKAKDELLNKCSIKVGDRVVWVSDTGPEHGKVEWLGFLPHEDGTENADLELDERDITAGIRFDNPIGKGTGKYKNEQLFRAPRKHASLVPVLGLLKESEFLGVPELQVSSESDDEKGLYTDGQSDEIDGYPSLHCDLKDVNIAVEDVYDYTNLRVGSFVKVILHTVRYGIIRWIDVGHNYATGKTMVGLEMEIPDPDCYTDGSFFGKHHFVCAPAKAFFIYLHKCRPDKNQIRLFGDQESPDVPDVVDSVNEGRGLLGEYKGIQGHENSSFLDCTLLACFLTTNALYDLVLKTFTGCAQEEAVKEKLIEGIVNPLRKHHYVRADKVLQLRVLIQDACNVRRLGLPDLSRPDNDPELVMNSLFGGVFNMDRLLLLSRNDGSFVCHVSLETLPTDGFSMQGAPGISDLLELTSYQSEMKFLSAPSVLIIKIHRRKPHEAIYLDEVLDITDMMRSVRRECVVCGAPASQECRSCFSLDQPSLQNITFCSSCFVTSHSRGEKSSHRPEGIKTTTEDIMEYTEEKGLGLSEPKVERIQMSLFAVICKNVNHFVTFVKMRVDGYQQWMCFDSQADQSYDQTAHYIPKSWTCPDVREWTKDTAKAKMWGKGAEDFSENARRFLTESYLCFYEPM